ncbi:hypothetical protein SAMN04488550_3811 [Gordonia malaquae]|uniref:Uncharacterized protein n=1 Tax=Gordonia malaquae NBRC 108250 TaxID=1223542 RepID=M3UUK6_GORML|nr:hypothetical protein [Gordonia malaquae]GAC79127.1 hypothetical protein GM1_007_00860 [Gordonia malaquae NBRC 108250]SEE08831.1 hypothetical protein SAMN04488550_3811 [Gordonia malaquae]
MIEPQGPLPSEVYWRRRLVAVAAGVVAIVVVIALIIWAGSSSDDSAPKNAAAASSTSSSAVAPPPPPASSTPGPTTSEPVSGGGDHGSDGGPSSTAPAPPPPADPALQNACADQSLSVVLYTDKPTYTVGDQPVFTVVVTNGGLSECSRDLGKNAQNVVVRSLDGARTLWAAQDCAPDKTVNNQLLQPGQQFSDTITWSGTTSSAGCKKPRVQIPAGGYQAVAKIGEKESAPITFNVVKPAQQ